MCVCVLSIPRNSISTMLSCLLPLICPKAQAAKFIMAVFFVRQKVPHSSPRPQTNTVHVQEVCSHCRAAAKDDRGNVLNWVKCQRLNEAFYRDTKGCRNASEPRKRIIHHPSYCHKCTPVCRSFVVCLFVKFVCTICFLKQTRPFFKLTGLVWWFITHEGKFWLLQMSQTEQ